ncbi:hypothetical protein HCN44_005399 [Aphidius gifuensis]|uniref:Uncharacterized protein n=1 Tax=Aphidius gifuensis TaxID=684658 RepID=A0A834Y3M0_APHGI|nr:hypothetical protein HCN44_005399 [Aphidius gifuensis]
MSCEDDDGSIKNRDDLLWSQCPVCRCEMHEPRLLDCLHPICTSCITNLQQEGTKINCHQQSNHQKDCPICEYPLPGPGCRAPPPPPHYPLQHRLIMNAVLTRRATLHCSTCLRNYCATCGNNHCKIRKTNANNGNHEVWPLWKAKRFRRTTVCLEHPEHALRFFCIACQQVICSECLWRGIHRGHASEGHMEAAKRAADILSNVIKKARCLLDTLLLRYNARSFSCQPSRSSIHTWQQQEDSLHQREAKERVNEYLRLKNARFLLDAISLTEQLLSEGSDAEILSLGGVILKRFKTLGINIQSKSKIKENHQHSGVFHCCTFCSSGGRKEATCACGGTMPGGYKGCGHGHQGHPQKRHWSCCSSTTYHSICPKKQTSLYLINL